MAKKLVVYYSWSNGNTKRIAEKLAQELDADIVRIDTVQRNIREAMMRL